MIRTTFFSFALLSLVACGDADTAEQSTTAADGEAPAEMTAHIKVMEDTLFAKSYFDKRGAGNLLDTYKAFAKNYPTDPQTPEYLFRAAGVAKGLGDPRAALTLYDRIIRDHPSWERIADAYYLKAFTYDNDLDQKGEAQRAYEEVIERFPDHQFANDARVMIENLQYTDEELIERFERMNAEEGASAN